MISPVPAINPIPVASELEDFMESLDDGVEYLSDKLQKYVKQLVEEGTLTEPENVGEKKPTAGDTHKYMATCITNMATLFKTALLIPPTTSNIECGFSVMYLICSPLRTSFSEANLDHFMRICINGSDTFKNSDMEKMVDILNKSHGNKRLDLRNLYFQQR